MFQYFCTQFNLKSFLQFFQTKLYSRTTKKKYHGFKLRCFQDSVFISKKLNQQICLLMTVSFKMYIILPYKTGNKKCRSFLPLPRIFLLINVDFICSEYEKNVNSYSVWYLKKYWVSSPPERNLPVKVFREKLTKGDFERAISPGRLS